MKILTLNTWGGRAGHDALRDFFFRHKQGVDIFCLQEMWSGPYDDTETLKLGGFTVNQKNVLTSGVQEVSGILSDFLPIFHPSLLNDYGLLTLVRQSVPIKAQGEFYIHKDKGFIPQGDAGFHARNAQHISTDYQGKPLHIINIHGLWNGQGKTDTEDRLTQSQRLIDFLKNLEGEIVLCGDFNLNPDTKSIEMFERTGLRNLVKEFGITSTRTSFYTKEGKYADYVFVSPGLTVKRFEVLSDEVSDHAPLLLELG